MLSQQNIIIAEKAEVISKHSFRPVLKLSWSKEAMRDEVLSVEQMRTPEEQAVCCMATD